MMNEVNELDGKEKKGWNRMEKKGWNGKNGLVKKGWDGKEKKRKKLFYSVNWKPALVLIFYQEQVIHLFYIIHDDILV